MTCTFIQKLEHVIQTNRTHTLVRISPYLMRMPAPVKAYDDPFLPFAKLIINATRDVVCGYIFNFPAYLAVGAAGIVALERTIAYVDSHLITVIDGQFAGADYVHLTDEGTFNADALVLADDKHLSAYLARPDKTAFVTHDGMLIADNPAHGGIFWRMTDEMTIDGTNRLLRLKIVGDDVLYADGTAHFANTLRDTLIQRQDN